MLSKLRPLYSRCPLSTAILPSNNQQNSCKRQELFLLEGGSLHPGCHAHTNEGLDHDTAVEVFATACRGLEQVSRFCGTGFLVPAKLGAPSPCTSANRRCSAWRLPPCQSRAIRRPGCSGPTADGLASPTKMKTFWVIKYSNIYSTNK